ncbi:metallophosphoesterase family protein [Mucilaginibacter sp. FT3.2]|uniref:metallophosphoesterase family protein n=1 Tax=Mucilaginibacter sp. FT3.2 TaxID=2723090 RepID=UPI001613E879|nr:metallophosphoesterase [Mucilaginibacter sp. FT3.2]MBB6234029.1 putative phosphodiesterase [Mucilaginibacter sp. FT3.2]
MNYRIPVLKKDQPDDNYKFLPLPGATGQYPYHLRLDNILPGTDPDRMSFHIAGDTGGVLHPEARENIVRQMAAQKEGSFLYHLGDVVYHHGEATQYESQFFTPFEQYPGPIFAIAGNHDSDVNPNSAVPYQSLDAFKTVFCSATPQKVVFSGKSNRKSMVQPNIYWTLETPLVTIIGLHTNVPKFGIVTPEQETWFREELIAAPKDKMLIVCLHHAPYSADINHGASLPMIKMLESAFEATGVKPDIVFSGHVHNYQRFHKADNDGAVIPYIVSGAGGFDELHGIAQLADGRFEPLPIEGITLEQHEDTLHGFLNITIERVNNTLSLTGVYYTVTGDDCVPCDVFTVSKG